MIATIMLVGFFIFMKICFNHNIKQDENEFMEMVNEKYPDIHFERLRENTRKEMSKYRTFTTKDYLERE